MTTTETVLGSSGSLLALASRVLYAHRWLIGIVALYSMLGVIVVETRPADATVSYGLYSLAIFHVTGLFLIVAAIVRPLWIIVVVRPPQLFRHLGHDLRTRVLVPERLLAGGLVLVILPPFMSLFTSLKSLIPLVQPFSWDQTFMEWDRVLHGGLDPWSLLQPILGHPVVTYVVSFFYQAWVFVMYGVLLWQTFTLKAPRVRMQFLLTFLVLWILLGTLLATLLSSAGPCYYGRLVDGADPFAALMARLRDVATAYRIPALTVQENLWESYVNRGLGQGAGISAMPSMHVATAVLFALVGWRQNRRVGALLWAFAGVIMVGSVHLGWHYAVDGYVSIVLTLVMWRAVGAVLARDPTFADRGP